MEPPLSNHGTVETRDAFLNISKYGCKQFLNMEQLERGVAIQFLNREPLEPPVSKYGTVGTGGCKQFLNKEPLERGGRGWQAVSKELQTVGITFYIGYLWNHHFLTMEPLKRGMPS